MCGFCSRCCQGLIDYLEISGQQIESIKHFIVGADAWYCSEYNRMEEVLGSKTKLFNTYGITETTIDNLYFERAGQTLDEDAFVPLGRPIANTRTYILDEHLQPVPVGIAGELFLGGPCVALGYWNRPELTAEKFIQDPFSSNPNDKLYRTGDLARYATNLEEAPGQIEFLGRVDFQVKIRGFRIELQEIESVLLQHPQVDQAVVTVKDYGKELKYLVAYLTSNEGDHPGEEDLRSFASESLVGYMVPRVFMFLEKMPFSHNGKIDRKALPEPDFTPQTRNYVAPQTPQEQAIVEIWTEVLGLDGDEIKIGIHDNFFDLGGHSLLALHVVAQTARVLGVKPEIRTLIQFPTVHEYSKTLQTVSKPGSQKEASEEDRTTPVFYVPGIGQNVLETVELEASLGSQLSLNTLLPFESFGDDFLHDNLHDLAEHYVERIRQIQNDGPYHLLGYSWGGKVIVEMVRQMLAQDLELGFVGLIDSYNETHNYQNFSEQAKQGHLAMSHFSVISYTLGFVLQTGNIQMSPTQYKNLIADVLKKDEAEVPAYLAKVLKLEGPQKNSLRKAMLQFMEIVKQADRIHYDFGDLNFTPPQINYFTASKRMRGSVGLHEGIRKHCKISKKDPDFQLRTGIQTWSDFNAHFKEIAIDANHEQILKKPHITLIAEVLKEKVGI